VTLLAISRDEPADSRAFAERLGIGFPLLADVDGAVSRQYAGITSDDAALPGVTVIGRDGRIVFRHLASAMDDRVDAAELLAILDRTVGTTGPAAEGPGYIGLDRAQLRVDVGGGALRANGDTRGTAFGSVAALFPLGIGPGFGRHVLVGPWLSFEPRDAPLDAGAAIALRQPFAGNLAALQLTATGGYTPWDATGWTATARVGIWFAVSPTMGLTFDVGGGAHRLGDSDERHDVFATFGLARLIRTR
jgi:hypothetical protein